MQCLEADVILRTRNIFLHILVYFSPYIFKKYVGNFHLIYKSNCIYNTWYYSHLTATCFCMKIPFFRLHIKMVLSCGDMSWWSSVISRIVSAFIWYIKWKYWVKMHEVNNLKMLHRYIRLLSSEQVGPECEFFLVLKQLSLPNSTGTIIIKTSYFVDSLIHSRRIQR